MAYKEPFRSGCAYCNSPFNLVPCKGGCMVALYCSKEHQEADEIKHRPRCEEIHERRLDHLMMRRNLTDNSIQDGDDATWYFFLTGHLCATGKTRIIQYVDALDAFMRALSKVHTRQALEHELSIVTNWRVLPHVLPFIGNYHDYDFRTVLTASFLVRLNRDDECHLHHQTELSSLDVAFGHTCMRFENHNRMIERFKPRPDPDSLTAVRPLRTYPIGEYFALARVVQVLLMVRVAVDLTALKWTTEVFGSKVPPEILDQIRKEVTFSPFVWKKRQVLESTHHDACIEALNREIGDLSLKVEARNSHIWLTVFQNEEFGKDLSEEDSKIAQHGTEAWFIKEDLHEAWRASPRTLDYLGRILRGHSS